MTQQTGRISQTELTKTCTTPPPAGAVVTATYRVHTPYHWEAPSETRPCWLGRILPIDSPEAWEGSMAFYGQKPTTETVRAHLAHVRTIWDHMRRTHSNPKHYEADPFADKVPIAWEFGQVYWESWDSLIVMD